MNKACELLELNLFHKVRVLLIKIYLWVCVSECGDRVCSVCISACFCHSRLMPVFPCSRCVACVVVVVPRFSCFQFS